MVHFGRSLSCSARQWDFLNSRERLTKALNICIPWSAFECLNQEEWIKSCKLKDR